MSIKPNKTSPATITPIRPDSEQADSRHADARAQVLSSIDTAQDMLGTALVAGIRMTVEHGKTSVDEVRAHFTRCNSPDVYASYFNLGDAVQAIVGRAIAIDTIDKAEKAGGGRVFERVRAALAAIRKAAKAGGVKEMAPREARVAQREALALASAPKAKPAPRQPKAPEGPSKAELAARAVNLSDARDVAAFSLMLAHSMHRAAEPEGREELWRKAVGLAEELAETLAPLRRKVGKAA